MSEPSGPSGRRIAFVGPSLRPSDARSIDPGLEVLPPAGMGDLLSAVRLHRPDVVVLIDGTFMHNMSVFHKEILQVLSDGVWVIGASSMGALRAAEMGPFGMIGIGEVYSAYASGAIVDDDEVALAHGGPEYDHRPLSDPMVNIRATLDRAVALGLLSNDDAIQLAAGQKARYFPARSLAAMLDEARSKAIVDEDRLAALADLVRSGGVDVKASDARLAIEHARALVGSRMPLDDRPRMVVSAAFRATAERDVVVGHDAKLPVTFDRIRRHSVFNDDGFEGSWRAAVSATVIERLAQMLGIHSDESDAAAARAWLVRCLQCTDDTLAARLAALDMTSNEFERLVQTESVFVRLERWLRTTAGFTQLTGPLINELRLRGKYESARRSAGLFERLADESPIDDEGFALDDLMTLQAAFSSWTVPTDLDAYIEQKSLGDRAQFYDRLMVSVVALHELAGLELRHPNRPTPEGGIVPDPINNRAAT